MEENEKGDKSRKGGEEEEEENNTKEKEEQKKTEQEKAEEKVKKVKKAKKETMSVKELEDNSFECDPNNWDFNTISKHERLSLEAKLTSLWKPPLTHMPLPMNWIKYHGYESSREFNSSISFHEIAIEVEIFVLFVQFHVT